MKKISKLLVVALTVPLLAACDSLLPNFAPKQKSEEAESSSSKEKSKSSINNDNQEYSITWANWDGETLKIDTYAKGDLPSYKGTTPTRPSADGISYTFTGWAPTISRVESDKTYIAQYFSSIQESEYVTAKFINWNGDVLQEGSYKKGKTPSYSGATPTRPNDGDIYYTFSSWSPAVAPITENTTYVATYTSEYRQSAFTIRWVDWDGTLLELDHCSAGETPVFNAAEPIRPADNDNAYVFTGWSPVIEPANSDVTYVAQYRIDNENGNYTVTWYNYDGSFLYQDYFKAGDTPVYAHDTPTRDATVENTFAFSGWTPEITKVTNNASYRATYETAARQYEVKWFDNSRNLIYSEMVDYGARLEFKGELPTKASDTSHDYVFSGWSAEYCNGNTSVYPSFETKTRQYKITWCNYDGEVIKEEMVDYGTRPSYEGDTPTRNPEGATSYSFGYWTPSINTVKGDATYTASYYSSTRYVSIQFADYNGKIVWSNSYLYGDNIDITLSSYDLNRICRPGDAEHYYELIGWDKEIQTTALEDTVYYPVFEEKNCVDNLLLKKSLDETHYTVIGYKNIPTSGQVGIPSEYNGLPITEIGQRSFTGSDVAISRIVMSDSIVSIGEYAFQHVGASEIVLSSNLKTIGNYAFWNITPFTDINLLNIETIGNYAFGACWSIEKVTFGPYLSEIGEGAFYGCVTCFEIDYNPLFKTVDGVLYSKDGKELVAYPVRASGNEFDVPNGVERIGNNAFRNGQLREINLPDTLTTIDSYAFCSLESLKSLVVPNSVLSIGPYAFECCYGLESIALSNNLKEIGYYAFDYCRSLVAISLPESLETIDYGAFYRCSRLKTVNIPSSINVIRQSLFGECKQLETIVLPEGITRIEDQAFVSCVSISSIAIPEGVAELRYGCFKDCLSLDEVTLPSTISSIDGCCFDGCVYLTTISYNGTMAQWELVWKSSDWNTNSAIQQIVCTDGTITL